jgi:DNA polymerase III sliding clamp (beta) subunit (PCNA family)
VKLSAPARELSDAISLAGALKAGANNNQGVAHLATTENAVSIGCTDKAVGTVATRLSAVIHEPGEIAVSAGRLAAIASSFAPEATVEIEAAARGLNVVCGTSRSRFPVVPLVEVPPALAIQAEIGRIETSCADCLQLLEPLAAADQGRARFYLAGVFWQSVDDQLVAVSTDGIRLIRTSVAAPVFSEDRSLIVPTEVAVAARRLMQKADASPVTLCRSQSLIAFHTPMFSFTARLIDANFPAYEPKIPPPASDSVLCDRSELLAAVSRLSAAAPVIDNALVALSWRDGSNLQLYLARCPLDGADIVAAEVRGSADIALSLPQFAALLQEFSDDRIQLETTNEQPLVIRGANKKLALMARSKWNFVRPSSELTSEMSGDAR